MVQSSGPIKSMLSAFKRGSNSSKTPGKLAATGSGDSIASSGLGRRLFSFSPAKPPNSSRKLRPPVSDEPADLIPVGIQPIAAASTTPGLGSLSEDASIKVVVRIRPRNDREASLGGAICVQPLNASSLRLGPPAEPHSFSFDHVAQEAASQEDVFNVAGRPVVDSCLQGFNGCLLAYGQTGSGKTYSMLGPCDDTVVAHDHRRGLIQRIFEHLFATLAQQADPSTQTSVTCSFLEIYNETISDLLCPGPSALALREDARRGIFVEGLTEEKVASGEPTCASLPLASLPRNHAKREIVPHNWLNGGILITFSLWYAVEDVVGLLQEGVLNRRVGETQMNERSSRSHSVFTAVVERRTPGVNGGAAKILRSRLHLVDLAGSERQKTSGAAGERLKEASSINKSLSTLGLVIMSLVDQQQGRQRHVPYRDSKLTFLLQDSLGGNAKTVLVAAISPAAVNAAETLSTLRFADGAKRIKNKATVNEDSEGDVEALRCEIRKLKEELTLARQSQAQPVTPVRGPSRLGNSPMQAAVPMSTGAHAAGGEGARRALMGALRREEAAAAEVAALQEQMEGMRALVAAKDSDLKRTQMMLKLKESRLAQGNRGPGAESEVVAALQQEIDLLKAKVEAHPEVKRFALENLHLSQEVARLQGVVDRNELSALSADVTALRREILGMAEAVEAAQESAELASAEAHTARSVREALEGQLREAQAALAGREAVEGLQEQMEALKAEADELRLAVMAAETFKADAARMTTHAAE